MKPFNYKLFTILFLAGMVGAVAVIPYVFTSTGIARADLPVPVSSIVVLQLVQAAILLAVALAIGMVTGKPLGLGAPYLEALLRGKGLTRNFGRTVTMAAAAGAVVTLVITLLDMFLFGTSGASFAMTTRVPLWQRLLATLYGGIDEEILMRFFLMSVLAWVFAKVARRADRKPSQFGMWASIILTAAIFGVGHLPFTAQLIPLDFVIVMRALLLNGLAAIVFGWLFWKRGLEAAMISHFTADIFLLGILPSVVAAV